MNRKFLVLAVLGIVWLFSSGSLSYKPPYFFPLDNQDGEYKLTKKCPKGQGWNADGVSEDEAYCIEYSGIHVLSKEETNEIGFFRITVGNSEPDLEKLVGRRIKSIRGKFSVSNKQCIQKKCISLGGSQTVLDINEIQFYE